MNTTVNIPVATGIWTLKNPLMPAAATFGNIVEYKDYVNLNRLGALIPNSIAMSVGAPSDYVKFTYTEYGFLSSFGRNNIDIYTFHDMVLRDVPWQTTPVIVNTKAADMNEMAELAGIINDMEGIAGIEVNLNCPYGGSAEGPYWKKPERLSEMMRRVRCAAPDKVILAKIPTSACAAEEVALASQEGGADIFVSFNAMGGSAIDIHRREYRCGASGTGGYGGPAMKPLGVGLCKRCAQVLNIPVIGAGGISCGEDVLEYIMAGAFAVQVGSANFLRPDLMERLTDELEALMEKMNIRSLDEIRGCAAVC